MESNDARQVIYNFLAELPDTIKTEELMFLLLYCGRNPSPSEHVKFLEMAGFYLKQPAMAGIGAVLCSRTIIDFRLSDAERMMVRAERLIKEAIATNPDFPEAGLLGMPLRRKHYSAALDKWKKLRENQLSDQSIRDFEEIQLNPLSGKGL